MRRDLECPFKNNEMPIKFNVNSTNYNTPIMTEFYEDC